MTDLNKNFEICKLKMGLTEEEYSLMQDVFMHSGDGKEFELPDEIPFWLIEDEGEIHLSSVVSDFLYERMPVLPGGCSLEFGEHEEPFGIDEILDEGQRIIEGIGRNKTEGILCVTGSEGCGKHFYFNKLAERLDMQLMTLNLQIFLSENGYDEITLSRAATAFYIASVLYDAFPLIETDLSFVSDKEYCLSHGFTGIKNPENVIGKISGMFAALGMSLTSESSDGRKTAVRNDGRKIYRNYGTNVMVLEIPNLSAGGRRVIVNRCAEKEGLVSAKAHDLDRILGKSGVSSMPLGTFVRYVRGIITRISAEETFELPFEPEYAGESNESLKLMRTARTLDELRLPQLQKNQLKKICAMCGARDKVLGDGGFSEKFSYGNGLSVLFYGAPGTGKTMAAEVIATSLGKPLYRVELSQLINKYIGETQKNIGRIFDEAEKNDCVLLFDEADAVFAKRGEVSDAQDRYSNAETAYLLQRMESFTGICVLTTNLFQNFDEAFRRRITYMINFPMPDEKLRLELWKNIFPSKTNISGNVDFELLAKHFELSGAAIRNIAQHAALYAASTGCTEVGMEHIIDGILNEYSKTGKNLNDSQKEIIASFT